jgi:hypothetical protein
VSEVYEDEADVSVSESLRPQRLAPKRVKKKRKNRSVQEMECDERVLDTSHNLFQRILWHMERRLLFAGELCPPLIASLGGHMADLHQARKNDIPDAGECPFYFDRGSVEVLNIPINIIAPAGFSKSFMMKQFFEKDKGVCPIRSHYSANITEAAYSGREMPDGSVTEGLAYKFRNGFLLFNEISNIMIVGGTTHSGTLVNQVMESLSERHISKDTGNMSLYYPTYVTIWGGIQPARLNLTQGLGRRFLHVSRVWTPADIQLFKDEREKEKLSDKSYSINTREVRHLRKELTKVFHNSQIEKVTWEGDMYGYLKNITIGHLDQQMFERVLIGKEYLNQATETTNLKIKKTPENKAFVLQLANMNKIVAEGGDLSLLIATIDNRRLTRTELWTDFQRFGYNFGQFKDVLDMGVEKLKLIKSQYNQSTRATEYWNPERYIAPSKSEKVRDKVKKKKGRQIDKGVMGKLSRLIDKKAF